MTKGVWVQRAQDELAELCEGIDLGDAWRKYQQQIRSSVAQDKRDALGNPVRMRLTFVEWLRVWLESGHWHERGRGKFVMSRYNDIGDYAVGNVAIKTCGENVSEANTGNQYRRGKNHSAASKAQMRETHARPEVKLQQCLAKKNRIVVVFRGVEYPSIRAAERATGASGYTIRKECL